MNVAPILNNAYYSYRLARTYPGYRVAVLLLYLRGETFLQGVEDNEQRVVVVTLKLRMVQPELVDFLQNIIFRFIVPSLYPWKITQIFKRSHDDNGFESQY